MPVTFQRREPVGPVIGVRLPVSLHEAVYEIALRENVPLSEVVRAIVRDSLPKAAKPKSAPRQEKPSKGIDALTDEVCAGIAGQFGVKASDVKKLREEMRDFTAQKPAGYYKDFPAALRQWTRKAVDTGKVLAIDPHKEKPRTPMGQVNGRPYYSTEQMERILSGQE